MSLYSVLGVGLGATQQDVRKAYRKLALRLHPDKNKGEESEEWLLVQSAYEVLGDRETREEYDILGGNFIHAWAGDPSRAQPGGAAPDMAAYMAQQHEWRQQQARKQQARRYRQEAAARQRETEDFLSGVDEAIRSAAEACGRRYQPGPPGASRAAPPRVPEEESLQDVIDMLRKKRAKKLREDREHREEAERQKIEDAEWLRRQWEAVLDAHIEQDRADYEREREQRRQSTNSEEKSQLSEADAMIAAAKAEMEAMLAKMST